MVCRLFGTNALSSRIRWVCGQPPDPVCPKETCYDIFFCHRPKAQLNHRLALIISNPAGRIHRQPQGALVHNTLYRGPSRFRCCSRVSMIIPTSFSSYLYLTKSPTCISALRRIILDANGLSNIGQRAVLSLNQNIIPVQLHAIT